MEIREAFLQGKAIMVFGLKEKQCGYWVSYHVDLFFDTLEDALAYLLLRNRYGSTSCGEEESCDR